MLIGLMKGIGVFYYWTWFIWPFVFMFSFSYGLVEIIKDKNASGKNILIAAISLLIILAGVISPAFN
ncbi:MAG: uncharacterized protein K0R54_2580 [Clostridiaceae bacterium]|jgi:hypothetical protein|nr:uncharacterized protein [Clostridiaceae bacterium]